jgi:hypothetical protein
VRDTGEELEGTVSSLRDEARPGCHHAWLITAFIAGRERPDFAEGLEIADGEGLQAHQVIGPPGRDVLERPAAGRPQRLPGPFGCAFRPS